ncbi:hypothetical protein OS125_04515 [Corynebacterium sp. P7003]|uniref:Secreted protein n=1 Tax=Corynebacterium pygosceleis TaxID=2800406 RepID=A0ABT3WQN0_9CORY|nr:hypothetical protein [Corynebacterium pygosceleis]MCX7444510.1 hypothetical protein [Corynebacterium pygosceleis]
MHTSFRRSVIRSGVAAAIALSLSSTVLVPVATAGETGTGTAVEETTVPVENAENEAATQEDGKFTPKPLPRPTPPDDYTPPAPNGSAAQLSSGFNVLNITESLSGKSISLSTKLGTTGIIGLGWLFMFAFIIARQGNILPKLPIDLSPSADALQGLSSQILPQPAPDPVHPS